MNEYERMLSKTSYWDDEAFPVYEGVDSYEDMLCVEEQLFAEYLMEAGMIPELFEIEESIFKEKTIWVMPVINGMYKQGTGFGQPLPRYFK